MLTVKKIVRGILKDESLIQALNVSYKNHNNILN